MSAMNKLKASAKKSAPATKVNRCGTCGLPGHKATTCKSAKAAPAPAPVQKVLPMPAPASTPAFTAERRDRYTKPVGNEESLPPQRVFAPSAVPLHPELTARPADAATDRPYYTEVKGLDQAALRTLTSDYLALQLQEAKLKERKAWLAGELKRYMGAEEKLGVGSARLTMVHPAPRTSFDRDLAKTSLIENGVELALVDAVWEASLEVKDAGEPYLLVTLPKEKGKAQSGQQEEIA